MKNNSQSKAEGGYSTVSSHWLFCAATWQLAARKDCGLKWLDSQAIHTRGRETEGDELMSSKQLHTHSLPESWPIAFLGMSAGLFCQSSSWLRRRLKAVDQERRAQASSASCLGCHNPCTARSSVHP